MSDDPHSSPSDNAGDTVFQRIQAKAKKVQSKFARSWKPKRQLDEEPVALFPPSSFQSATPAPSGLAAHDLLRLESAGQLPSGDHSGAAIAPGPARKSRRRKAAAQEKADNDGDWMEEKSPAQAFEALQASARKLRRGCLFMDSAHMDTWRKYLMFFIVNLTRGQEREAASYLESVLHRFANDGAPVGEAMPTEDFGSSTILLQRAITAAAEDPQIPLSSLQTLLDVLHTLMGRYQALPVAYSFSRLPLISRLGLTGEGEADFIEARHRFQFDEEEAARARANEALLPETEPSWADAGSAEHHSDAEDSEPSPTGYTCQGARLAFLVEWLHQHMRDSEALALLEAAHYGADSRCYPCGLGPTTSYAFGIRLALDQGRATLARQWLERVTLITELKPARWLFAAGHRAEGHARLGEIAEALAVLEKAAPHADNERISPWSRMWFHHHAASALLHLVPMLGTSNPTAIPDLQNRAQNHAAKSAALAQAFDCRNGNTGVSGQLGCLTDLRL